MTSRASVVKPPKASTSARCSSACSSDWCACWPWRSTSCSPSAASWASVTGWPLTKARERPCASSTRRTSTSPSSPVSAFSASQAPTPGASVTSKSAASSARSAPGRICRTSKRSPSSKPERVEQDRFACAGLAGQHRESRVELDVERIDEHEVADRQQAQHREAARAAGSSGARTGLASQALRRFAPVQLLAQHREVVVAFGVEEPGRVRRALDRDAFAFGEREARLAVAMRRRRRGRGRRRSGSSPCPPRRSGDGSARAAPPARARMRPRSVRESGRRRTVHRPSIRSASRRSCRRPASRTRSGRRCRPRTRSSSRATRG